MAILAVAAGALVLGGANRAQAALRLVVTDGTTTDVFYTSNQSALSTGVFSLGGYNLQVQTLVTNFPGTPALGNMSTTVNITSFTGGSTLTTTTDEIVAVAGATEGLETGGNIAAVQGAALLPFTGGPTGSPVNVTADTSDSTNPSILSGTATTFTRYNGAEVVSEATPLTGTTHQIQTVQAANSGTYTLGQRLTLTGLNTGASSINYTGNSSVNAVPAPAGIVLALSGLPFLGLGTWVRRRKAKIAG